MNVHINHALASIHAAHLARRARMSAPRYSPKAHIPQPEKIGPPPAPEIATATAPAPEPEIAPPPPMESVVPPEFEEAATLALRVLAERQKIRSIIKETADHFGLPFNELVSSRRTKDVVTPRQLAMWICIHHKHFSYPEIGRRFGRSHATVIHACRKIDRLIAAGDAKVIASIETITTALGFSDEQG
jgi:hypothetical protein